MPELQEQINVLKREIADLRYIISKKIGSGSADIKGTITAPSTIQATATIGADSIKQAQLDYELASVTVTAGNPSGTATVTSGSIVIGWRATGNQDQLVDNISVSGTTLTVTLAANATLNNTFEVTLLKA